MNTTFTASDRRSVAADELVSLVLEHAGQDAATTAHFAIENGDWEAYQDDDLIALLDEDGDVVASLEGDAFVINI